MRYYLRQKLISIGKGYEIEDEKGKRLYSVSGNLKKAGECISIVNNSFSEIASIEKQINSVSEKFQISVNGNLITIKKNISMLRANFDIKSNEDTYEIEGTIFDINFKIKKNDEVVANVSKKRVSFNDRYEIDIVNGRPEGILAIVVVIDYIIDSEDI